MARALSRLALGRGGPRDLGGLRDGLARRRGQLAGLFAADHDPLLDGRRRRSAAALQALDAGPASGPGRLPRPCWTQGLGADLPALARDGGFVAAGRAARARPGARPARRQPPGGRSRWRRGSQAESGVAAEDPPQRRAGLFRRGHGQAGRAAVAAAAQRHLHPPPDPGQPGALHHRRAGRPRRQDRPGRRAGAGHRAARSSRPGARRPRALAGAIQAAAEAAGAARRRRRASPNGREDDQARAARRSTARSAFEAEAARHPVVEAAVRRRRRAPSRPTTAGSTGRARRARGCPSSPARTWPASRPSCARTPCWPSSPRPAASCRPSACGWAWSTGCSAAWAPATTWRAAARPSWPRWSRPPPS